MSIENHPGFSHWCEECGGPVGKSKKSKAERGGCLCYGNKTLCYYDYKVSRGLAKRRAGFKSVGHKGDVPMDPKQRIKHENNVLGLQHYMERRRERLARKCRISM